MGIANRRAEPRMALQMFVNEYVKDRAYRCLCTNMSPTGLYMNRLLRPDHLAKVIGLEFELPGVDEVIWARGEVRYDARDPYFHGTGIELTGMAGLHERLLRDYVVENRIRELRRLLACVRRNRLH